MVGEVDEQGLVKVWGLTRFLTDEKGHYVGHKMQHPFFGLEQRVIRAAHEQGSDEMNFVETLYARAKFVGTSLFEHGYRGPFGIDAFIYDASLWTPDKPIALQAMVEINSRWTMGHVAHQLQKKLPAKNSFSWRQLMKPALLSQGFASFSDFAKAMALRYGKGFVPTNDPDLAKQCLSYLISDVDTEQD